MSIRYMTLVWDLPLGNSGKKLVALALADNANDEGECYPSLSTIARKTDLDERTVRRAIRSLEEDGLLQTRTRSGRSCVYRLLLTPLKNDTPGKYERGHSAPPTPDTVPPHPSHICRDTPDTVPPITVTEPSEEPSKEPRRARDAQSLADARAVPNLDVKVFDAYLAYRREIRKPIRGPSLEAAAKKLAGFGLAQAAVLKQSIENSWIALFPLKVSKTYSGMAEPIRQHREFPR